MVRASYRGRCLGAGPPRLLPLSPQLLVCTIGLSRVPSTGSHGCGPWPASWPSLVISAAASHNAIARGVSPYPVDNDSGGWAEHQGCHDENSGQDDQDDDPDIQDVLGEGSRTCGIREVHPAKKEAEG